MNSRLPPKDSDTLFIACDDIRQELGGKLSLMGVYFGNIVLFTTEQTGYVMPSLAMAFVLTGGEGEFDVRFDLLLPSGGPAASPASQRVQLTRNKSYTHIVKFAPFHAKELGAYRANLTIDGQVYTRTLTFGKEPSPSERP